MDVTGPEAKRLKLDDGTAEQNQQFIDLKMLRAATEGDVQTVRSCLANGANPNFVNLDPEEDYSDCTALHVCAAEGHVEVASLLLERGADVNFRDGTLLPDEGPVGWNHGKRTPLYTSAACNQPEVAALLIRTGADLEAVDIHGDRPLHQAAAISEDVTKLLVEKGADVNAVGFCQWTPLHNSVGGRNLESARILLSCPRFTVLRATDRDGCTALDVARKRDEDALVKLLGQALSGTSE